MKTLDAMGLLLLVPAMVLPLSCSGESPPSSAEARPPLSVDLEQATEIEWRDDLEVTAGVRPWRRATPGTVLMGTVSEVLRGEGDRVRRGDVLARIENRDVKAKLAQARAAVAAASAMERNAKLMRERMERLVERQAASRKDVDDAIAGHEAALAHLAAAEEGVGAAELFLDYAEIRAPFDGVVTEKRVEVGDTAAPGMPLFVLEDVSRVKVEGELAESTVAALRVGDPALVEVQGATRAGQVTEILPAADPRSRTFTVRVALDNPGGALRSGTFARLRLSAPARSALAVPDAALVQRGPLTGIYVVDGAGVARLRWITAGRRQDGRTEVLTGLVAGERFVTLPGAELADGRAVEARR